MESELFSGMQPSGVRVVSGLPMTKCAWCARWSLAIPRGVGYYHLVRRIVMIRLICCLAVLVALVVPASADIVTNGKFLGTVSDDPGSFTTVYAGDSTTIPDWTVTVGSVD